MDLRTLIGVLRKWFALVVLSALLAGAISFLVSGLVTPVYEASATVLVGPSVSDNDPRVDDLEVARRRLQTYAFVARTTPLMERVIAALRLQASPSDLQQRVRAEADTIASLIRISAQDGNPEMAAALANGVADELARVDPVETDGAVARYLATIERQAEAVRAEVDALAEKASRTEEEERRLETLQVRLANLLASYSELSALKPAEEPQLSVIQPAAVPRSPVVPNIPLNVAVAVLLGLAIGLAIALLVERLDDTVKTADDVRQLTELPTLGEIGAVRMRANERLITLSQPQSAVSESFRSLRTNVEFLNVDSGLRSILVSSAAPGEGKTTVAANLAVVFAQAGRRTLLVDGDLRLPRVHDVFNLPNDKGLTSLLLSDDLNVEHAAQKTPEKHLRVVTAGPLPPNPAELLASKRMQFILDRLTGYAELVIFDSPSMRAVTDAAILASIVDGMLLVVDAGRTRRGALSDLRDMLERANARIIGVALNRVGKTAGASRYYDPGRRFGRALRPEPAATHEARSS